MSFEKVKRRKIRWRDSKSSSTLYANHNPSFVPITSWVRKLWLTPSVSIYGPKVVDREACLSLRLLTAWEPTSHIFVVTFHMTKFHRYFVFSTDSPELAVKVKYPSVDLRAFATSLRMALPEMMFLQTPLPRMSFSRLKWKTCLIYILLFGVFLKNRKM